MQQPTYEEDLPQPPGINVAPQPQAPAVPPRPEVFAAAQKDSRYTTYTIDTEYTTDNGIAVLPVSGLNSDGTAPAVPVRYHCGLTTKRVKWSAERVHEKPIAPSPNTGDPNEILVHSLLYPANALQDFNAITYRISGEYIYHLIRPKVPGHQSSKYPMGTTPAEVAPSSVRYYDYRDFSPDPLDASQLQDGAGLQMVIQRG